MLWPSWVQEVQGPPPWCPPHLADPPQIRARRNSSRSITTAIVLWDGGPRLCPYNTL